VAHFRDPCGAGAFHRHLGLHCASCIAKKFLNETTNAVTTAKDISDISFCRDDISGDWVYHKQSYFHLDLHRLSNRLTDHRRKMAEKKEKTIKSGKAESLDSAFLFS
jgi:hypothetical protein